MLEQYARKWLSHRLGDNVRFDEPMARHTSFRIGGPADALVEPESEVQLKEILQWIRKTSTPFWILGGGTNLLVRDGGIRGLVIRLGRLAGDLDWEEKGRQVRVKAGAGVPTRRLCRIALQQGWQGMNFALGIPGTLGGAILMNAGTARGAMADVLEALTVLTADGEKVELPGDALEWRYRQLRLPESLTVAKDAPAILLTALIRLKTGDAEAIRREARQIMVGRARRQPGWEPSAGCFFKNPAGAKPAGQLIDEAGLKGSRVGDAQVSSRHANFIINRGRATAAEILELAALVRQRVEQYAGVRLTPEVHVIGEEKVNP